jgi:polysaccharide deacetylase family protein (PEP-CTERM system associated)
MTKNALTIDAEDWGQSTLDRARPITERVAVNTRRLLALLAEWQVRATFFVQGMVAERFPELVIEIAEAGHELATHGYSHQAVYRLGRERFASELSRSMALIEGISGQRVTGHRAADFSITSETPWAMDVLRDHGLRYDSSIFPSYHPYYGTPGSPCHPYCVVNGLVEFPVATVPVGPMRLPVAGGGYFRLFPYFVTRWGIRRINASSIPAVLYLHPYELDECELTELGREVPWRLRLTQGTNRSRTERKLRALLRDFAFGPLIDLLPAIMSVPPALGICSAGWDLDPAGGN